MLAALAWRNLWRQQRRTALSLFSIAFTSALLVFMLSFQAGVYEQMKETTLKLFDGYAQIQPVGYADDPDIRKTIDKPREVAQEALSIPGVAAASPRVHAFAILANGDRSYGALIVGVDPTNEPKISTIASNVRSGRYLLDSDQAGAVLGETLARNLKLTVGENVTVLGSAFDGSVAADVLRVEGIYRSGIPEIDRSLLQMPLARAQETFGLGDSATTIALSGSKLARFQTALPVLMQLGSRHGLAVRDWGALEPALRDSITLKYVTSSLFYITLVVVVTFIILNTLLMSVLERTREFGILMAIGMRPTLIGAMVWMELAALALAGAAIGIAVGGGAGLLFEQTGISIFGLDAMLSEYGLPTRLYPSLTLFTVLAGPSAITLSVCIGGIVPYVHVQRLTAAIAMRAA